MWFDTYESCAQEGLLQKHHALQSCPVSSNRARSASTAMNMPCVEKHSLFAPRRRFDGIAWVGRIGSHKDQYGMHGSLSPPLEVSRDDIGFDWRARSPSRLHVLSTKLLISSSAFIDGETPMSPPSSATEDCSRSLVGPTDTITCLFCLLYAACKSETPVDHTQKRFGFK